MCVCEDTTSIKNSVVKPNYEQYLRERREDAEIKMFCDFVLEDLIDDSEMEVALLELEGKNDFYLEVRFSSTYVKSSESVCLCRTATKSIFSGDDIGWG